MSIVMIILLVIGALVALVLILGAIAPKGYQLSRSIAIDRPVAEVFNYLRYIKNQDNFNKWTMTDPDMKRTYRGTDGTVGFVYGWNGNAKAGEGEQEIKGLEDGRKIDLEVRFKRPFVAVAHTPMETEAISPSQTKVTWHMKSNMKYPMNMMLLFMDMNKLLGKDVDTSLGMLKGVLEKR